MKKRRKVFDKIAVFIFVIAMLADSSVNIRTIKAKETKKQYIVTIEDNKEVQDVLKRTDYKTIDNHGKIIKIEMTDSEAKDITLKEDIISVENNIMLKGSQKPLEKNKFIKEKDSEWNLNMINADKQIINDSDRIKVAIIDSGVNYNSSVNIKKRINLVDGENEISPLYEDYSGHGTAIAGLIAGQYEDGYRIGVDSDAEIISIKVLDENNSATVDKIIEAIYIAIDEDVNIINMSFGTTYYSEALHTAIKDAYNQGILIVAAAGNRGNIDNQIEYPAAFDEVLSVGSVNSRGQISDISSTGEKVDIYAPGESIKSAAIFDGNIIRSGTSMAVPHVVGVASKLWSKDKSKSSEFIKNLIIDSANETTNTKIVDLEYALNIYNCYSDNYKKINKDGLDNYNGNSELEISKAEINVVEGSWSQERHQNTIQRYPSLSGSKTYSERAINLMIAGIRLVDEDKTNLAFDNHSWWHAGTMKTLKYDPFVPNYFSTIELIQRVIHATDCNVNSVQRPAGFADFIFVEAKNNLINAINSFNFKAKGYERNITNIRYVYLGMLLHTATDLLAHRVSVKHTDGIYYYINNPILGMNTDNVNDIPERYTLACYIVRDIMDKCINPSKPYYSKNVTLAQFTAYPVYYSGRFKIHNFYEFALESGWSNGASSDIMQIIKNNSLQASYHYVQ